MGSEWNNDEFENNQSEDGGGFEAYREQEYAFQTLMRNGRPKSFGLSVAALIMGVMSLFCSLFGWAGVILGVAAIVFSIMSRRRLGYFDKMSIAGLVLGIFGFVFGASVLILVNFIITEEMLEEFYKMLEEYEETQTPDLNGT